MNQCNFCPYVTVQKSNLKRHQKAKHPESMALGCGDGWGCDTCMDMAPEKYVSPSRFYNDEVLECGDGWGSGTPTNTSMVSDSPIRLYDHEFKQYVKSLVKEVITEGNDIGCCHGSSNTSNKPLIHGVSKKSRSIQKPKAKTTMEQQFNEKFKRAIYKLYLQN